MSEQSEVWRMFDHDGGYEAGYASDPNTLLYDAFTCKLCGKVFKFGCNEVEVGKLPNILRDHLLVTHSRLK